MRAPILKQGPYLIASIQSALSDDDLLQLRDDLTQMVGKAHTKGIVIDVTAMDVVDSFAARTLKTIVAAVKMRGAESVIVGIQPEVAFAMVQLGLSLVGVETALDLEDGMAILSKKLQDD